MKTDKLQDLLLRGLVIVSGVVAACLLTMKGQAQALPALAVGAVLGTCMITSFESSQE